MTDTTIENTAATGEDAPAGRPFGVYVHRVGDIAQHPGSEGLTLVTLAGHGEPLVANKREDGSWRYAGGDLCQLLPVGAVLPDWLLDEMDARRVNSKGKTVGTLGGNKGNRVVPRTFADTPSNGMLRRCGGGGDAPWTVRDAAGVEHEVTEGQDVAGILGIVQAGG